MRLIVVVVIVFHVIHSATISFPEAFAKIVASISIHRRMFVHVMVIGIGVTMLAEIVAGGFDALMITALLCFAISGRRLIPMIVILILSSHGNRLCFMSAGFESAG